MYRWAQTPGYSKGSILNRMCTYSACARRGEAHEAMSSKDKEASGLRLSTFLKPGGQIKRPAAKCK